MKKRLDQLVAEQLGITPEKAQAIIMSGNVLVNEQKLDKPGTAVNSTGIIRILGETQKYVSRGGLKLEAALQHFQVKPQGKLVLDIGASTGGFTDCLLQQGAARVIALDVGHNQLAWKIRSHAQVTVIENCNFRYVTKLKLAELSKLNLEEQKITLAVIDVSFISLDKILPPLYNILEQSGEVIALVKPQFEAERAEIPDGGIVKDPEAHRKVLERIKTVAVGLGFKYQGEINSPITGTDGNTEFLIYLTK